MYQWLVGSQYTQGGCQNTSGTAIWACNIKEANGVVAAALWQTNSGTATYTVGADSWVDFRDVCGNRVILGATAPTCNGVTENSSPTSVTIATQPILLEGPVTASTSPAVINFSSGFTSTTGLQLNGNASWNQAASQLELTNGGSSQTSSVFFTTPVNVQSFTTSFSLQLINPNADGMTFTIQNAGVTALGGPGGGLGYGPDPNTPGGPSIGTSIAVKFDLYNNDGEGPDSTGEYADGATPTVPAENLTSSGLNLHSGDIMNVQMSYNGTTLSMTITDATTNASFSTSWTVNIPGTVGGNTAYVGFTGGTGGLTATQEIVSWSYAQP
jgi:hypothetical protein